MINPIFVKKTASASVVAGFGEAGAELHLFFFKVAVARKESNNKENIS